MQDAATTGLVVKAALHPNDYSSGKKLPDDETSQVHLQGHKFKGDWNYTIQPRRN
jgi:hypothetical protein